MFLVLRAKLYFLQGAWGSDCSPACGVPSSNTEHAIFVLQDTNCTDGRTPFGGVVMDSLGNLFGTTVALPWFSEIGRSDQPTTTPLGEGVGNTPRRPTALA
jgi:hypothetical protein